MKNVFAILLIASISANQLSCLKYICNTKEVDKEEVCATQEVDSVKLTKCKKGLICSKTFQEITESRCEEPTVAKGSLLPGQSCNGNDECYSSSCDNICKGFKKGEKCNNTKECDVDLYCDGKNCVEAKDSCEGRARCPSNKFCHLASKHCYSYGEIKKNNMAPVAPACESYYAYDGNCSAGLKLIRSNNDDTCTYNFNEKEIKKDAICVKKESGKKECEPGRGNINVNDVISDLRIVYQLYEFTF